MHLYFAYGSNLHPARLEARIGACDVAGVATLRRHRLMFHKRGRDGSGKCDAHRTGDPADVVHGVLYRISRKQQLALHRFEGVGRGYESARIVVQAGNSACEASTYIAQHAHIEPNAMPFSWYHALVLGGARFHRLPAGYVDSIASVAVSPDPDPARHARHMRLVGRLEILVND